jgi:hypothetical protein
MAQPISEQMLKLRHDDRLGLLSHIGEGVEYVFDAYFRPYAEKRVFGRDGVLVADISPHLRQAHARVLEAVADFERQAKSELADWRALVRSEVRNREAHERAEQERGA